MAELDQPLLTPQQRGELDEAGYTVVRSVLSDGECDEWSRLIDDMWEEERSGPHDYDEEAGVRFTDNLLRYSCAFEKAIAAPAILEGVRYVLGEDVIVSLVNGRRADPGYGLQPLHELQRRRGRPFVSCNTMWCLDEFTALNGATRVIPGSHLSAEPFLSRMEDPMRKHPDETQILAPRGAVVIFNSHLLHAGDRNATDKPRRCVHSQFTLRGRPTEYAWHELPGHILAELTPQGRGLLGLTAS